MTCKILEAVYCGFFLFLQNFLHIKYNKKKKGRKNMLKKYSQPGVTFYCEDKFKCTDIDIDTEVTSVKFTLGSAEKLVSSFFLRDVKKQFPNVTELVIPGEVTELHISNYMFPNVRNVKSSSIHYFDGVPFLVSLFNNVEKLENSFCLKPDETLDLSYIYRIGDYALEGCCSNNVLIGYNYRDSEIRFNKHAFDGSAYILQPYNNGIRTFANYVIDVDKDAKEAVIPNNITRAIKTVDFTTLNKIVFGSVTTACGLSEHAFPKTVSLEREDYLSHMMIENVFINKYIENFELDEKNGQYCTKGGVLYSKDGETLTLYPRGRHGSFTIPDGVIRIEDTAFARSLVDEVTLPPSLAEIGNLAFYNCGITKLTVPPGMMKRIGEANQACFASCKKLTTIDIASTVRSIDTQAFEYCDNLTNLIFREGLCNIAYRAFYHCNSLTEVELPSSIEYTGDMAFDRAERVILNDNMPKNMIGAIAWPDANVLSDRYTDEKKVVKVIIKSESKIVKNSKYLSDYFAANPDEETYTILVPKYINKIMIRQISTKFNDFVDRVYGDNDNEFFEYAKNLYSLTSNVISKQATAFAVFERFNDNDAKSYIKRSAKNFAAKLIERNDTDTLIRLLDSRLCSKAALKSLHADALKDNNTTIAAYLMQAIGDDKVGATTFRI